ncbi:type VI secretion system baseplate subunit TssE [Trinickia sp. LjRoot230]|uniref:type VI secretion system baseplate subunit TssE n=1 Tax=Trinickia sp. LjRoot230 TaxID=3342288 RepID=UPI003ED05715
MAELTSKDRLQPALLDRLSDDAPSSRYEARERRVVSAQQLRRSVLRDLSNLLNATGRFSYDEARPVSAVEHSVLNYGLPDFTGKPLSTLDPRRMSEWIARAIRSFEPRIVSETVRVSVLPAGQRRNATSIAFLIEGDLWMQPYPERLYFRTDLDLEAGDVSVSGLDYPSVQ